MELKLPYGLRDNELITIDNVDSGLKCNCVCPYCKQRLIARKGEIKEHHFAHYKVSDCGKAVETVTHRLSKDFIKGAKFFTTPPIYFPGTKVPIIEESQVPIDDVKLESRLGFIVPDIIIDSGTKSLIVEIRVTHGVDDEKASKIRRLNLPAVEVFAGQLMKRLYTEKKYFLNDAEYKRILIEESAYKRWINNPRAETKIKEVKNELKNYCEEKEVKHLKFKIKKDDFYDFYFDSPNEMYYVENCPINKKVWRGGPNKGKTYANYNQDCRYCKFNPDAGHNMPLPNKMNCAGHILEFSRLLKSLR
jgi:hypothetical protein